MDAALPPLTAGTLYLVATPIGNLEDITLRALRVLRECDVVAAEDTRHSGRLLKHFGISKPLLSYFQFNEARRSEEIIERLRRGGKVALIGFWIAYQWDWPVGPTDVVLLGIIYALGFVVKQLALLFRPKSQA